MSKVQQFVLKEKEIFVGLEDAKKSWKLCVRSGGVIVDQCSMPANYEGLRNYFHKRFPGCTISVMYEAGFRGFGLHDKLTADGWKCVVTPPHTVTQEKCTRQKNDRIDSRRLAKNLENNDYKTCHVPSKEQREDRQVARLYSQVQRDITRTCNRIRRGLEFHDLDDNFPAGAWNPCDYRRLAEKLPDLQLSESLLFTLTMLLQQLQYLWQLKKEILRKLRELARMDRYQEMASILESAPGVGPLTAIRLTLEWGDLRRFNRKEDFASFLGLIPSDYSTGEQDRKGHITKQGNRQVRAWLIESSWTAIKKDPALLAKYNAVMKNSGSAKKAIVAVARKLAIRLRALVLTGQCYQVALIE